MNQMDNQQAPAGAQDPMAGISFPMGNSAPQATGDQSQEQGAGTENSDQYKEELTQMLDSIQEKVNAYNSQATADGNEAEQIKGDLINKVFEKMVEDGVNLEKPEQIQQYLAEMEAQDPQKFALFSNLMNKLMEAEAPGGVTPESPTPGEQPGMQPPTEGGLDLSQVPTEGGQPQ